MTPNQIAINSSCYGCSSAGDSLSQIAYLLNAIANKAPSAGNFRITELGDFRTTEAGDFRIVE